MRRRTPRPPRKPEFVSLGEDMEEARRYLREVHGEAPLDKDQFNELNRAMHAALGLAEQIQATVHAYYGEEEADS